MNKEIIYIPTKEEKEYINNICNRIIELLNKLPNLEQKSFALQTLISSFEETYHIQLTAIMEKK